MGHRRKTPSLVLRWPPRLAFRCSDQWSNYSI